MPYINIPESELGIAITRLIAVLKAQLIVKVTGEVNKLLNDIRNSCGDLKAISTLSKKVSGLKKFNSGIKGRVEKIRKITSPLARIITTLNVAIKVIKLLPIPNRFTNVGITNVFSEILHKLKEFVKQLSDDVKIVDIACNQVLVIVNLMDIQLSKVDNILKLCAENPSENPGIQQQLLSEIDLDSTTIQQGLTDQDYVKVGNELFKNNQSLQNFNQKSLIQQNDFSTNLGLSRKDVAKSAFIKNLLLNMDENLALTRTNLTKLETRDLVKTYNETLRSVALLNRSIREDGSTGIRVSTGGDSTQTSTGIRVSTGGDSTQTSTGIGVSTGGDSTQTSIDLRDNLTTTVLKNQKIDNHIGPDGTFYEIFIEVTDLSKIAPKRKAVALDKSKKIRYQSDESFSFSTDVLSREVKFKIDNDIN